LGSRRGRQQQRETGKCLVKKPHRAHL
jgi:hypothetical protein